MALDRQQHVGEAAEHMRADRLALVGAGHAADLVRRDAEMVGPEPDQPLGEADLGAERGLDAGLGLVEIDLLPRIGRSASAAAFAWLRIAFASRAVMRRRHPHGGRFRHLLLLGFLLLFRSPAWRR